ncbi:cyclase family protein [Paenibacillus flagellatus]|uniref:Cyclase family protein n=1 Tax=Paenibacillus flagellatus TaxID=2211139 RepID=A0A2V5KYQ5_9BACL|nr:cyclase family protein [Paenibacillus flagellatus]PYI55146.1 cyclase family protein [Paenibacillus flagellatus]
MRIANMIDLSQELYHNCPVLPEFEPPKLDYLLVGARDGWTLERVTMNLHSGTHMDAPAHLGDFSLTLDRIPVERFQGEALFVPLNGKREGEPITAADLEPYRERMHDGTVVLLYTGWGEKRSWSKEWVYGSPYLSNEAARLLVAGGVRGVGIDHFSIGGTGDENRETHRILLGASIWVAEGLQLNDPELAEGSWHVFAMPVKIRDSSGAPARVVAIRTEG